MTQKNLPMSPLLDLIKLFQKTGFVVAETSDFPDQCKEQLALAIRGMPPRRRLFASMKRNERNRQKIKNVVTEVCSPEGRLALKVIPLQNPDFEREISILVFGNDAANIYLCCYDKATPQPSTFVAVADFINQARTISESSLTTQLSPADVFALFEKCTGCLRSEIARKLSNRFQSMNKDPKKPEPS